MIKKCITLDGKIINIGEWELNIGIDGNVRNPFPIGAIEEERNFEFDADRGWFEIGVTIAPTIEERTVALEQALLEIITGGSI